MPFTKLVKTHGCPLPTKRPDDTELEIGDEWRCDEHFNITENGTIINQTCGKKYRWHTDQREGEFWMALSIFPRDWK